MNAPTFPPASAATDPRVDALLEEAGTRWVQAPARPAVRAEIAARWATLLAEWAADPSLPLLIRKAGLPRGTAVTHSTGRALVPVDNSPAHWAYSLAVAQVTPDLEEIRRLVADDRIPVAMILKASERRLGSLQCTLAGVDSPQAAGWKLAHCEPVGLASRTPLSRMSIATLCERFVRLMDPSNMFVVPGAWAGLAEVPAFLGAVTRCLRPA